MHGNFPLASLSLLLAQLPLTVQAQTEAAIPVSHDGRYALHARLVDRVQSPQGERFTLTARLESAGGQLTSVGSCPSNGDALFVDGFENPLLKNTWSVNP